MGILITKGTDRTLIDSETQDSYIVASLPIFIKGTDIELDSVYARVTFEAHEDGKTVKAFVKTYKDASFYADRKEIETSINLYPFDFVLSDTETQSVDVVLIYVKTRIEEFGYNAQIQ